MNAQISTLHGAVFLQVVNDLCHDGCRNGKTISGVGAGFREQHGIDADELAFGVDKSATRVAFVDGGIGLNETLNAIGTECAGFGADDAGCHRVVESERITHGDDPFSHLEIVGVANWQSREILAIDLDQGKVGGWICADDAGVELSVVFESNGQFVSTIDDMVVGDDISVGADDDSRSGSLLLGSSDLTLLYAAITATGITEESEGIKEIGERITLYLHGLCLGVLYVFNIDDGRQCLFGSVSQINRLSCHFHLVGGCRSIGILADG